MRAGVDNGIRHILMGQIDVRAAVRKSKLKNPHAGKIKLLAQGVDLACDEPEVFRNKWQISQFVAQTLKELRPGSLDPFAVYRC